MGLEAASFPQNRVCRFYHRGEANAVMSESFHRCSDVQTFKDKASSETSGWRTSPSYSSSAFCIPLSCHRVPSILIKGHHSVCGLRMLIDPSIFAVSSPVNDYSSSSFKKRTENDGKLQHCRQTPPAQCELEEASYHPRHTRWVPRRGVWL